MSVNNSVNDSCHWRWDPRKQNYKNASHLWSCHQRCCCCLVENVNLVCLTHWCFIWLRPVLEVTIYGPDHGSEITLCGVSINPRRWPRCWRRSQVRNITFFSQFHLGLVIFSKLYTIKHSVVNMFIHMICCFQLFSVFPSFSWLRMWRSHTGD